MGQRVAQKEDLIYNYATHLSWNQINKFVIRVGSTSALTYCFWYLTMDTIVITIPLVDEIIPYFVSIAKKRNSITDNNAHLLLETTILSGSLFYYYLFRQYSHGTLEPETNILPEPVEESRPAALLDFLEFDFPNGGTCIPTKRDGKLICKEVEEVFNIPENKDCIPIHKDGEWNCKKEDVKPEPETGICTIVIRDGKIECKEGGDVTIPTDQILTALDNPGSEDCIMMKKDGNWICRKEEPLPVPESQTQVRPETQVGPEIDQKTYQYDQPSPVDIWSAAVWTWGAVAG